jgi:hypothetical protein
MGFIDQGLRDVPLHAGQADIQPGAEEICALLQTQIDLGFYNAADRKNDRPSNGCNRDGVVQAGRPGRREQLLRIGAYTGRTGGGKSDVEKAVRTA